MKAPRCALPANVIEEVGVALYGQFWRRNLAKNLGVSDMSLRRWSMQQHGGVPVVVVRSMAELLTERKSELSRTGAQLRSAAKAAAQQS